MTCKSCGNILETKGGKCKSCGSKQGDKVEYTFTAPNIENTNKDGVGTNNQLDIDVEKIPNLLLIIVSLLFMPLGIGLYIVLKKDYNSKAKMCLWSAIIGAVVIYLGQMVGSIFKFTQYQTMLGS